MWIGSAHPHPTAFPDELHPRHGWSAGITALVVAIQKQGHGKLRRGCLGHDRLGLLALAETVLEAAEHLRACQCEHTVTPSITDTLTHVDTTDTR